MALTNCGLIKMDNVFRNVCLRNDTLYRNNPKGQRIVKAVSRFSYTCKIVFNKSSPLKCFLPSPCKKTPRLKQVEFSFQFCAKNGFPFTLLITLLAIILQFQRTLCLVLQWTCIELKIHTCNILTNKIMLCLYICYV